MHIFNYIHVYVCVYTEFIIISRRHILKLKNIKIVTEIIKHTDKSYTIYMLKHWGKQNKYCTYFICATHERLFIKSIVLISSLLIWHNNIITMQ